MPRMDTICAKIRCIDRVSKAFSDRFYWLDLGTLNPAERRRVEAITIGRVRPEAFHELRPLLHAASEPDDFKQKESGSWHLFCVPDYFEDDAGNPLDEIGLIQILTGQEQPVLLNNVGSVLRLGPCGIAHKEVWTVETANTLAHFFQLVEIIGSGDWLKRRLSIGMPAGPGGPSSGASIHSFECPDLAHIYSILLPFRQLYAADRAFINATDAYLWHAQDERKKTWIRHQRDSFNAYLASAPRPHAIENYNVQQLFEIVMYGAGLIHYAKTKPAIKQAFHEVMSKNHREWVVFTFLMGCRQLFGYASHAYYVMVQDFQHWTKNEGCQAPDLVFQRKLFASHALRGESEPGT